MTVNRIVINSFFLVGQTVSFSHYLFPPPLPAASLALPCHTLLSSLSCKVTIYEVSTCNGGASGVYRRSYRLLQFSQP